MRKLDILIAILVAFVWGSNFIAIKMTVIEVPGLLTLAIRFLLTAIILLPFSPKPKIKFITLYKVSLVFGVFYMGLLYYGMHLGLNTNLTIIIMQLNIPISIVIAKFFLKEDVSLKSLIGIGVAFAGMLVVIGTPHLTGNILAAISIFIASIFYALFNIQSRQFKQIPALSLLCWPCLISAPHLFLLSYFVDGNPLDLIQGVSYIAWISMAYSILISGIFGITAWIYLLQIYPVHKVLPFNLLVPFFGCSLSILILKEIPCWHILFGGVITLFGIAITQVKRS